MKIMDFNILFLLIFINSNCVLNANKIKFQNKKANDCIETNEANKEFHLENALNNSKTSNTTFFVFFSNRKDNFAWLKSLAGPLNSLLEGELNLIFHCGNYTAANANFTFESEEKQKANVLEFYVVKNGSVEKNETLTFLSRKYVAHLLNNFNLTHYLEKKYPLSDLNKKKYVETDNSELTSFIQLTLEMKCESDSKKTAQKPDDASKNKQTKLNEVSTNNFLKRLKNTNETLKVSINTHTELTFKNLKEPKEKENSNQSEEDSKTNLNHSVIGLKNKRGENLNKTEEREEGAEKSICEEKENQKNKNITKQEYSEETIVVDRYSGLENEHSLKTVTQLKRVSEEQGFSSFLEKESLTFTDAIENSKIILLPNKIGAFSFAEINQNNNGFFNFIDVLKDFEALGNKPTNRLSRFFLALFIVLISSLLCFMFIKYSIDWATKSKSELNSLQDRENREILEEINKNHNLIRFN